MYFTFPRREALIAALPWDGGLSQVRHLLELCDGDGLVATDGDDVIVFEGPNRSGMMLELGDWVLVTAAPEGGRTCYVLFGPAEPRRTTRTFEIGSMAPESVQ